MSSNSKKKSPLTPKEIARKRLLNNKLMKIDLHERNFDNNKENMDFQLPIVRSTKIKDKQTIIQDNSLRNPFNIANRNRVFTKSLAPRKLKPIPLITPEPRTICDVDATFYNVIEGRPLRRIDDIKVYMRNIRDITLFKANASYLKDQVLQIKNSYTFEINEYKEINQFFHTCQTNFSTFVKEDYNLAEAAKKNAKDKSKELKLMKKNFNSLNVKFGIGMNNVGSRNVVLRTLMKYREFLNLLSPRDWLAAVDVEYKESELLLSRLSTEIEQFNEFTFDQYKDGMEKLKTLQPKLFFKKPMELLKIFDNIGYLCLSYMEINVESSKIVKSILKSKKYLEIELKADINEMKENIEIYESYIKIMEEKERDLNAKFEKVLFNEFQNLFASYDTCKLFTCLQYTNTILFKHPEDPKDSLSSLMFNLEHHYFELTSGLDSLNQNVVKKASNEYFSQDLKMMKQAYKAQRTMKESDILRKALYSSLEPPKKRNYIRK